ncbi:MAG: NAD(P)-binding protein [Planctomycetes bacterium]|nr:NAD(P)-binding protein [Planctomycetota bacterium]
MEAALAVIGSGFGGLGAALRAQELGRKVVVFEALNYPGGCASTFAHRGYRFEAGATLFSGMDEHQPFGRWLRERGLDVTVERIDPLVELRTPFGNLKVVRDRKAFADGLCAWVGERPAAIRAFLDYQKQVADVLWELFEEPSLLPPLDFASVWRHLGRSPRYWTLTRLVGRSLGSVLRRFGLEDCVRLRTFLDAVCQITVQVPADEAEAPFALAAMDYFWRGTGHIRGGIGVLAQALVDSIETHGGEVRMSDRVRGLEAIAGGWRVHSRSGTCEVRKVAANLLPQDLQGLLQGPGFQSPSRQLARWSQRVQSGWGACMLYRVAVPPVGFGPDARHLQLVQDPAQPLHSGNHLFASISGEGDFGRCPEGMRTLTVSTHVPLASWSGLAEGEQGRSIEAIQHKMRAGLAQLAPEWEPHVVFEASASPRTFERFTRRTGGWVGGIPRRVGLGQYADLFAGNIAPGLALVGDSAFPGQSTLAAALGGHRAATRLLKSNR